MVYCRRRRRTGQGDHFSFGFAEVAPQASSCRDATCQDESESVGIVKLIDFRYHSKWFRERKYVLHARLAFERYGFVPYSRLRVEESQAETSEAREGLAWPLARSAASRSLLCAAAV